MRRANGTGTVVRLSGQRRNPYVVRVPGRNKRGRVIQTALGYYPTAAKAQTALDEYNRQKAAGLAPASDKAQMTVQQVYELWSARKYAKAGTASVGSYKAAWARLESIAGLRMCDVTIDHMQAIIDRDEAEGRSSSSIANVKMLLSALYKCALERDIVVKDYSAFVQMPSVGAKHEKGAFSDAQLARLWELHEQGFPWADTVLMLCYTGFRITEFLSLTPFSYDRENGCLRGGVKTEAGKNRVVPVHPRILPLLEDWLSRGGDTIICTPKGKRVQAVKYREDFSLVMAELGVPQATPHWCRHTFASRAKAAGMDELAVKRILGHADKNVTEHYTHTDVSWLAKELQKVS